MKPGIFPQVPFDEYLADPALSRSRLRTLLEATPMDFNAGLEVEETEAMRRGTALHMSVLEPDRFDELVRPMPKYDGRTNAGKAAKAEWLEANAGKVAIAEDDYMLAQETAALVRRKNGPAAALRDGQSEVSMFWDQHGTRCKARVDFASPERGLVCDIKSTTKNLDDRTVTQSLTDNYTAMQLAMQNAAHYALTGKPVACYLLMVRLKRPVDLRLVYVTPAWIEYGEAQFMRALAIYRECVASGSWPGWAERGVTEVVPPQWVINTTELLNRQNTTESAA